MPSLRAFPSPALAVEPDPPLYLGVEIESWVSLRMEFFLEPSSLLRSESVHESAEVDKLGHGEVLLVELLSAHGLDDESSSSGSEYEPICSTPLLP